MDPHMRILIVEDSPTDTELLKYLLEDKFQNQAKFREANSLETAFKYLNGGNIDCVLLDLQLPDSAGKETFLKINERFPDVPTIVMTHNKDRDLAIEMIRAGAADYILKDFSNEEDIFRRILFAIEKHQRTVRAPAEKVASFRRVERAQADMVTAHQSGQHAAIRETTVETTSAIADLSRNLFTGMQEMSERMALFTVNLKKVEKMAEVLSTEVIKGESDKPSMKARMDVAEHRLNEMTQSLKGPTKISAQTKTFVAICIGLGIFISGVISYIIAHSVETDVEQVK